MRECFDYSGFNGHDSHLITVPCGGKFLHALKAMYEKVACKRKSLASRVSIFTFILRAISHGHYLYFIYARKNYATVEIHLYFQKQNNKITSTEK